MSQIGRFEVLREIGRGSFGTVYKAVEPTTQKLVALRKIDWELLGPGAVERRQQILQTAQRAVTLDSPNISRTLEAGEGDSYIYVITEHVEGVTLRSLLAQGNAFSPWDLADFTRQVCSAIDHAQSRGLSHANLHPGNIVQEWDNNIKLMDYGLGLDPLERAALGSPVPECLYYLSPEQARKGSIDQRSNLFSWGVMLCQMITGQRPFEGQSAQDVLENIISGQPQAARVMVRFASSPDRALLKALAKKPEERFQSGNEMVRALEACNQANAGVPTMAPPKPAPSPAPAREMPAPIFSPAPPPARAMATEPPPPVPAVPKAGPAPAAPVAVTRTPPPVVAPPVAPVIPKARVAPTPAITPAAAAPAKAPAPPVSPAKPEAVSAAENASGQSDFIVVQSRAAVAPRPAVTAADAPVAHQNGKANVAARRSSTPGRHIVWYAAAAVLILAAVGLVIGFAVHRQRSNAAREETIPQSTASVPQAEPAAETAAVEALAPIAVEPTAPQTASPADQKRRKKQVAIPVAPAQAIMTADLTIESSPPGAHIQLDGRALGGVTPLTVTGLNAGEHTITLTRDEHATEHRTVQLQAGQRAAVIIPLSELRATLSLASEPEGASVFLDGKDTGKQTPVSLSVSKGSHSISVTKNGFFEARKTVDSAAGQAQQLSFRLTPMGRSEEIKDVGKLKKVFGGGGPQNMGRVQIKTVPKGAQIMVNGRVMGKASPAEFYFPAGVYEISLALDGYKTLRRTLDVNTGGKLEVNENLEKNHP